MSIPGLSIFNSNKDTLCASKSLLLLLIYHARLPHNKNKAVNPARKDCKGFCGIATATINAAAAMLHQGRYKQAATLSNAMRTMEIKNFMIVLLDYLYCCPKPLKGLKRFLN
jgi:hypothetical protein